MSLNLGDAPAADGVIIYHIALSRGPVLQDPLVRHWLLSPPERAARAQVWQLVATGESHVYYPAGADPLILGAFDITVGSDRAHHDRFTLSFFPDWDAMLRPVSLADKLAQPAFPRRSNITLIQSNCNARSGRDAFLRELLKLVPVDSFGKCHNNRDPGEYGMDRAGWAASQLNKHDLARGYKFVLAFENSIAYDYVTEKALDAWEAGAVPVYRGAPNIADYLPGDHSLVEVEDGMTPAELAARLRYLDSNDTAYMEYHAWRLQPPAAVRSTSPLGLLERMSNGTRSAQCVACAAVHERRSSGPSG